MVQIEHTVVIDRPPAEVFAYITEPANLADWQATAIEGRKESEGPIGVGSRLAEVRKFLGKRMETTLEVTEYEPERRFSIKALSGPVKFDVRHTFEAADGGTRLTFVLEGEPGGFFKLAEPVVARAAERQVKSDFDTLKDVLEAR